MDPVETLVGRSRAIEPDDCVDQAQYDEMAFPEHVCGITIQGVNLHAGAVRVAEKTAPRLLVLEPAFTGELPLHLEPRNVDGPGAAEFEETLAGRGVLQQRSR